MAFRQGCACLGLLLASACAMGDDQQPQNNNPLSGINSFFKGLTNTVNGAINKVNQAATSEMHKGDSGGSTQTSTGSASNAGGPQVTETAPQDISPSIDATALSGIFTKHPYDGTAKSYYPKVAVTITNWAASDCWDAHARIWWSASKSEHVKTFKVCWHDSLTRATDNAVNYQLFMRQMAIGSSGNVRTEGPKAPMMAYPMPDPFGTANYDKGQQAISFIEQVLMDTGWQAGAPTNIWVVKYEATTTAPQTTAATSARSTQALDAFQKCDISAMPRPPVSLPGGFMIIKVQSGKFGDGDNKGMKLVFQQRMERLDLRLKNATGYDFTSVDSPKSGQIGFDHDETGEQDNYLICYRQL